MDTLIGVLRGQIEEQFRISERLDSKARHAFTIAAAFFAGAQAAAFNAIAAVDVKKAEKVALLAAAAAALIALLAVGYLVMRSEQLRTEDDIRPARLREWREEKGDNPSYVGDQLLNALIKVSDKRAENNARRVKTYKDVRLFLGWALFFSVLEAALALALRL